MNIPKSVEVLDEDSKMHTLSVKVLGAEETWQTPSLLLATETNSGGKVVFSQVICFFIPIYYIVGFLNHGFNYQVEFKEFYNLLCIKKPRLMFLMLN